MGNKDSPPKRTSDKKWCLYMHTSPSGKRYVGITSCDPPQKRWGLNGSRYLVKNQNGEYVHKYMARAINKYNWDDWIHEILLVNESEEFVKKAEKCLIKHYKSNNPKYGYNLTLGGDGTCGYHLSDERRELLRKIHLGKKHSEETKRKLSISLTGKMKGENHPHYGKHHSEESKKQISVTLKEKYKNGWNQKRFQKTCSDETRKKISAKLKGDNHPMYGKHFSEEVRHNMSEARKKILSNKENHPNYGKHLSEATKNKIGEKNSGINNPRCNPIYCLEMDMIFYGASQASEIFGFDSSCITKCCRGKRNYAYQHPVTKENLHWIYASEAIKKGLITNKELDKFIKKYKKEKNYYG